MSVNLLKALVALVGLIGITVMTALHVMESDAATLLYGTVLGYILGNGVNAAKGNDVPGIIRPKPEGRRADDRIEPS